MRPSTHSDVISYVRAHAGKSHIILIDPDDASPDVAAQRCVAAVSAGTKMIFVGGSSGTDEDNVHSTVVAFKKQSNCANGMPAKMQDYQKPIGKYR